MIQVSVMYPGGSDATFDTAYYLDTHMPLVRARWSGMGLVRDDLLRGVATPDRSPVPFPVIALLTFESAEAFKAAAKAHGAEIFGDIPNFTNVQPSVQINEPLARPG